MRGNTSRGGRCRRVTRVRIEVDGNATVRSKTQIDMQIIRLIARGSYGQDVIGVTKLTKGKFTGIRGHHLIEHITGWIAETKRSLLDRAFCCLRINRSGKADGLLGKEILRERKNRGQRENSDAKPGHNHPNPHELRPVYHRGGRREDFSGLNLDRSREFL